MTALLADDDRQAAAQPTSRVRLRPAPTREPPFDDDQPTIIDVGQLQLPLPFPVRARTGSLWPADQLDQLRPAGLPDPAHWTRRVLVAILEARAGRRPIQQLAPHISRRILRGLAEDAGRRGHEPMPSATFTIRSVHASEPAPGIAEVAAVVQLGPRCHAIAARLEVTDGRWQCVRLQIG
jgi:hypothetical protein